MEVRMDEGGVGNIWAKTQSRMIVILHCGKFCWSAALNNAKAVWQKLNIQVKWVQSISAEGHLVKSQFENNVTARRCSLKVNLKRIITQLTVPFRMRFLVSLRSAIRGLVILTSHILFISAFCFLRKTSDIPPPPRADTDNSFQVSKMEHLASWQHEYEWMRTTSFIPYLGRSFVTVVE